LPPPPRTAPPPLPGGEPGTVLPLPLPGRASLRRFLLDATAAIRREGGEGLLAGGFVRDLLLGIEGKDADLVAASLPPARLAALAAGWEGTLPGVRKVVRAGRHFPVHKVRIDGEGEYVDVASPEAPRGASPAAVRGWMEEAEADAGRRDFTVNALFLRLSARGGALAGEVIDFHGGLADLARRRLRAVGDPEERLREDPARILRLVRLCASLEGFRPDRATCEAARRLAPALLPSLPGERVAPELFRAFAASPRKAVALLRRLALLPLLLPPAEDDRAEGIRARRLAARLTRLRERFGGAPPPPLLSATLLLLLADGAREGTARRLALPGIREALRLCTDAEGFLADSPRAHRSLAAAEAALLRHRDPEAPVALLESLGAEGRRGCRAAAALLSRSRSRPPFVSGKELSRMGVPAGEEVGRILSELREEELAGRIGSRGEAILRARALASRIRG
jgi:tRNA nucleotidyltransferase/poly(A) polymerase